MEEPGGKYHVPRNEEEGEVLPNKLDIKDPEKLAEKEAEGFAKTELNLLEELTEETVFDVDYIRDIHRKALLHIYDFAGEYRSVNMAKGGFSFAAAHVIPQAMKRFESAVLLNLPHKYKSKDRLIDDIATIHAELLFIHPFREGNGRTMRILANLMSYKQGYPEIDFTPIQKEGEKREEYIKGVQSAAEENYKPMIELISELFPSS